MIKRLVRLHDIVVFDNPPLVYLTCMILWVLTIVVGCVFIIGFGLAWMTWFFDCILIVIPLLTAVSLSRLAYLWYINSGIWGRLKDLWQSTEGDGDYER